MKDSKKHPFQPFVDEIRAHPTDFYRARWGNVREFASLPLVGRADFIQTPLSQRRYKPGGLVKVVGAAEGVFLSGSDFADIGREAFGVVSQRPMVAFDDAHEAMEKAMWCYEHDTVPLLAEKDPRVALYMAGKYSVDSLVTDAASLEALFPHLVERKTKLSCISIVASAFFPETLARFMPYAERIRLVLALPETGAFAESEMSESPVFKPLPDCHIEILEGEMVLTKSRLLVTPIVRYKTGIRA